MIEDLVNSDLIKVFRTSSADPVPDNTGLTQTAGNPHEQTQSKVVPTGFANGEGVGLLAATATGSCTQHDAASKSAQTRGITDASGADVILSPPASSFHPGSQSDTGRASECSFPEVTDPCLESLTMPAGVGGQHRGLAQPEDNEIAAADWLEVVNAMSDIVYAS